jgi:CheY-like chemotaxis protein
MRKSLLEDSAPQVVRVLDASEALCMVESADFAHGLALVVTGHRMSGISGPEFVAELRSRMPQVPVLVLSAVSDAEREYDGIPDVVVSQTTSPDELRTVVKRMVKYGKAQPARSA